MSTRASLAVMMVVLGCGRGSPTKPAPVGGRDSQPAEGGSALADGTVEAVTNRPRLEVRTGADHVDLPPVPAFDLPAVEPGFHSVRELLVRGAALRDTEVKVHGYVTWI